MAGRERHFGASAFIQNGMDFQRSYHFEVSFTWKTSSMPDGEPILPTFAAQSVSLPKITCQGQEFGRGNSVVKFPGTVNFDDLSISFVDLFDASGNSISAYFYDWFKNTIYNFDADNSGQYDTNKAFMEYANSNRDKMKDSTHKIIINELFPDGEIAKTWLIEGVWISNLDFGQLDYTANDKKIISVSFSYSRISMTSKQRSKSGKGSSVINRGGTMDNEKSWAPQPTVSEIVASASSGGFGNIVPSMDAIQDIFKQSISQVFSKPLSMVTEKLSDVYSKIAGGDIGSMVGGMGGGIGNIAGGNPVQTFATKIQGTINQALGGFGGGKWDFQDFGKLG